MKRFNLGSKGLRSLLNLIVCFLLDNGNEKLKFGFLNCTKLYVKCEAVYPVELSELILLQMRHSQKTKVTKQAGAGFDGSIISSKLN